MRITCSVAATAAFVLLSSPASAQELFNGNFNDPGSLFRATNDPLTTLTPAKQRPAAEALSGLATGTPFDQARTQKIEFQRISIAPYLRNRRTDFQAGLGLAYANERNLRHPWELRFSYANTDPDAAGAVRTNQFGTLAKLTLFQDPTDGQPSYEDAEAYYQALQLVDEAERAHGTALKKHEESVNSHEPIEVQKADWEEVKRKKTALDEAKAKAETAKPKKGRARKPAVAVLTGFTNIDNVADAWTARLAVDQPFQRFTLTGNFGWTRLDTVKGSLAPDTSDGVFGFEGTYRLAERATMSASYTLKNDVDGEDSWSLSAAYALSNDWQAAFTGGKHGTVFVRLITKRSLGTKVDRSVKEVYRKTK